MDTILVVDDDAPFVSSVQTLLSGRFEVLPAKTVKHGLEMLKAHNISVVVLDAQLPDMPGREVIQTIHRDFGSHIPVIVVTEHTELSKAVQAMRAGAYDYIPKGSHLDLLPEKIAKALELRTLRVGLGAMQNYFAEYHDRIILASEEMKRVSFEITRLARLDFDVLLVGETGVGKDLAAYELHRQSERHEKPFVLVPLRSLSESLIESELFGHERGAFSGADKTKIGKLEAAQGGTLYIPEVSSMKEDVQLKLLQFMQYKTLSRVGQDARKPETRVDVRIVMATNEDPRELMLQGKIRQDFYHRITGIVLHVPPLRERVEAIEYLAKYFLEKFSGTAGAGQYSLAPEVIAAFKVYKWPGNIRELKNAIQGALVRASGKVLTLEDFPLLFHHSERKDICSICLSSKSVDISDFKSAVTAFRRAYFLEVLKRSQGNVTRAAAAAGMTPQGFRKTLQSLDVTPN